MALSADRQAWDAYARDNPYYHTVSWEAFRRAEQIDEWAEDDYWRSGEATAASLLALLNPPIGSDATALEIGCGIGRIALAMAGRVGRVIGCDVSPEMVRRADAAAAARGVNNAVFHETSGDRLDGVASDFADLVYSYAVFQHLSNSAALRGYLGEMQRVLRPGGRAVFQMPTHCWRGRLRRGWARVPANLSRDAMARHYWLARRSMRDAWAAVSGTSAARSDAPPSLANESRRMKSIHLSRLRRWSRAAGLEWLGVDLPDHTYTTVIVRKA